MTRYVIRELWGYRSSSSGGTGRGHGCTVTVHDADCYGWPVLGTWRTEDVGGRPLALQLKIQLERAQALIDSIEEMPL